MSREQSAIIKGLALLLMLLYHLPKAFGVDFLIPSASAFIGAVAHPVMYFVIISGYGLYMAHENGRLTWKYLLKRSARLYISFWLVMVVFIFGIATWMYPGRFDLSPYRLITNFIGWRWDYCQFTWFFLPYILMTFCSKWVFWVIKRIGSIPAVAIFFIVTMIMAYLVGRLYDPFLRHYQPIYLVVLTLQTLFCFTLGAAMARRVLAGKSLTWSKLQGKNPIVFIVLITAFILKGFSNISFLQIPPFFMPIVVWIILHFKLTWVSKYIFIPLGNKSMMMWFAHGYLAFKMFSEYFLLIPNKFLIWLAWVIVSYCVAYLLMPVSDWICQRLKLSSSTKK